MFFDHWWFFEELSFWEVFVEEISSKNCNFWDKNWLFGRKIIDFDAFSWFFGQFCANLAEIPYISWRWQVPPPVLDSFLMMLMTMVHYSWIVQIVDGSGRMSWKLVENRILDTKLVIFRPKKRSKTRFFDWKSNF